MTNLACSAVTTLAACPLFGTSRPVALSQYLISTFVGFKLSFFPSRLCFVVIPYISVVKPYSLIKPYFGSEPGYRCLVGHLALSACPCIRATHHGSPPLLALEEKLHSSHLPCTQPYATFTMACHVSCQILGDDAWGFRFQPRLGDLLNADMARLAAAAAATAVTTAPGLGFSALGSQRNLRNAPGPASERSAVSGAIQTRLQGQFQGPGRGPTSAATVAHGSSAAARPASSAQEASARAPPMLHPGSGRPVRGGPRGGVDELVLSSRGAAHQDTKWPVGGEFGVCAGGWAGGSKRDVVEDNGYFDFILWVLARVRRST